MGGVFADWQPRYAELGIATFPVREKRPAVGNYLKMGVPASRKLVSRFPEAEGLGLACRPNNITILDVDAPDERLFEDAIDRFGPTPFVVRSGSGNFQAWYRNSGERRRVRPDKSRPIDILGDGYVVAPPSKGGKRDYEIIQGSLADLAALPPMRAQSGPAQEAHRGCVEIGGRNDALWRLCMLKAKSCATVGELTALAIEMNHNDLAVPLDEAELLRIVNSAWNKEIAGENWFGAGGRIVIKAEEVDDVLLREPDAFILLTILRRHHWGAREFVVANAMASSMPNGGWRVKRFAAARRCLERIGQIEMIRPASKQRGPAIFHFKGSQI